ARGILIVGQLEYLASRGLGGGKVAIERIPESAFERQIDEMRCGEFAGHDRSLEFTALDQRVAVDVVRRERAGLNELGFVRIDRQHQLLAGVEATERENDLRATINNGFAENLKTAVADNRQSHVSECAESAILGVEEHVAGGETITELVAVDHEPVE